MITDDPYNPTRVNTKSSQKSHVRLTLGANPYYRARTSLISATTSKHKQRMDTDLVGITTDARHSTNTEIKRGQSVTTVFTVCKTSRFQEGDNERTKTTVHVETNIVSCCQCTERDDIVLITIWEVDCRTHQLREDKYVISNVVQGKMSLP